MKIIADTHVHTIASEHAFSTVLENLNEAKEKGMRFIAITDHTGKMPGAPTNTYFACLKGALPDEHRGVYIIRGCEVNVLDENGTLDLPEANLKRLEWVIASVHSVLTKPMTVEQSTKMWLAVAKNPDVDVIGHSGDESFRFDYERVITEFKKYGKIVEINSASARTRAASRPNCVEIARLCAKHGVPLVISSDAHYASYVGDFENALSIVREAGVPEELILNADEARFAARLSEMTGRKFNLS